MSLYSAIFMELTVPIASGHSHDSETTKLLSVN